MKRNLIIAFFLFCLPATVLFAQGNTKKFTGTVTYRITYPASTTGKSDIDRDSYHLRK